MCVILNRTHLFRDRLLATAVQAGVAKQTGAGYDSGRGFITSVPFCPYLDSHYSKCSSFPRQPTSNTLLMSEPLVARSQMLLLLHYFSIHELSRRPSVDDSAAFNGGEAHEGTNQTALCTFTTSSLLACSALSH